MFRRNRLCLSVLFLFVPASLFALANNNVRVDRFEWKKIQTPHFDVYYDEESEGLLPRMVHYLEKAWWAVGGTLNVEVKERTPFFFYSNHNQFEQTNVVPIGEGTGGVTEAFKNRFLIFNDGSETWMKHVIYHEFAHVAQFNVFYGGFWKSVRLLKSPFYPLWLMEGMAEYVTGELDAPMREMIIRDAVYHKLIPPLSELQGFSHLKPNQITLGYKTGEMAMRFLADEYGPDKVGKFLTVMEGHFDVSSALVELLGTDLEMFDFRFQEWLRNRYRQEFVDISTPAAYGERVTHGDELPTFDFSPVVSPDGATMYYFSDRKGMAALMSRNLSSGEIREIADIQWTAVENYHSREGRSLSISPDGRLLAFTGEKKQKDYLYLFDTVNEKLRRISVPFDQIRSPKFSPDGESLVCVGMVNGFNDVFIIDFQGHVLRRLTESPQDESSPVFTPDGRSVIFSGEVLDEDRLNPAGRDLFAVDLETKNLRRVTHFPGDELEPLMLPDGNLLLIRTLGDGGDVGFNLHYYDVANDTSEQLTRLAGGAFTPVVDATNRRVYYAAYNAGYRLIYRHRKAEERVFPDVIDVPDADVYFDLPKKHARTAVPLEDWPGLQRDDHLITRAEPVGLELSTDFFLPFFFFSSLDGFVFADVWQFSDTLGNHQFQQQLQLASKNDFIDLAAFYTYAKFRPQFTVGGRFDQFFVDFDQDRRRREVETVGLMRYPLDRVNSVSVGVGTADEREEFLETTTPEVEARSRFWLTGFSHDTVTGRYLVPTSGRRLNAFFQQSVNDYGSNQQYKSGVAQAVQYIRLPRESTLAMRAFYGRSVGSESQVFRLGGVDRIRALSRGGDENKKSNIAIGSAELRFRLSYLNARTKFLFPDFFFKAAYLILFDDYGYGWDNREEREDYDFSRAPNSAGAGVAWPTFILQSFQLNFSVLWAQRTDQNGEVWYVTVGSTF